MIRLIGLKGGRPRVFVLRAADIKRVNSIPYLHAAIKANVKEEGKHFKPFSFSIKDAFDSASVSRLCAPPLSLPALPCPHPTCRMNSHGDRPPGEVALTGAAENGINVA